jgi:membrane AbrB-like protein
MLTSPQPEPATRLASLPGWAQWLGLLALSALFSGLLELAAFPAALLIGPMAAAILWGVNDATIAAPNPAYIGAQAVIGCLIAAAISPEFLPAFLANWPLFLGIVLATLAASSLLGWLISRWRILPGTVGVWGSSPGAATAMVLMAGAFGADQRLVAFMQYLRVIMVTAVAAVLARLWVDTSGVDAPAIVWFPPLDRLAFAETIAVAAAGALVGRLAKMPSLIFLAPMVLGIALKFAGLVTFDLPPWLLAACYAVVGWTIGLRFRRETLAHVRRALPQVSASIAALILFCGALGFLLWKFAGVDPLTAYLATSPGGMDSVAIIAAASHHVDLSFIMVLQILRFLIVLIFGPAMARLVAGWVKE